MLRTPDGLDVSIRNIMTESRYPWFMEYAGAFFGSPEDAQKYLDTRRTEWQTICPFTGEAQW